METVKLNNDLECPVIGIGTYMLSPGRNDLTAERVRCGQRCAVRCHSLMNKAVKGTDCFEKEHKNENDISDILNHAVSSCCFF